MSSNRRVKIIWGLVVALFMAAHGECVAQKRALIIGVTGQDGSYLAEFLLEKCYKVYGMLRYVSSLNTGRIEHLCSDKNFQLVYGDSTDPASVLSVVQQACPDEVYNLAAQSHVRVSFDMPNYTAQVDALGTLNVLEAIRQLGLCDRTKFYQASTSELYGKVQETPQTETTPFYPRSPYACAKLYSFWITKNYREAYAIFACNGILFNHESPRRSETIVTQKIVRAVARIKHGLQEKLYLGNLDAKRDWGYAKDYVRAMWLMLQQETPDDFVVATGQTHSVREFVERAFAYVGITLAWKGIGVDEVGYDVQTGKELVAIDPCYFRPTEVELLLGDATKANKELKWKPSVTFTQLVERMMQAELEKVRKMVACAD